MDNTFFVVASSNSYTDNFDIPADFEKVITVGNSYGDHDYTGDSKPNLVLPNIHINETSFGWNLYGSTSKCCAIMTGILANFISSNKLFSTNYLKENIYKSATLSDNRLKLYGYGIPMFDTFKNLQLKLSNNKNTIQLNKGWNLISFYYQDINLKSIINNENINQIYSDNGNYKINTIFNSLKNIDIKNCYWIEAKQKTSIEVIGKNVDNIKLSIKKGWNIIPIPFSKRILLDTILNNNILSIIGKEGTYNKTNSEFKSLNYLEPNKVYFLKSDINFELEFKK